MGSASRDYLLPTAAREALAELRGRRLARVRRMLLETTGEATTAADAGDGALELQLDDGTTLHLVADAARKSVTVALGELPAGEGTCADVSRNAFWRYRLRREILGVRAWKSLDVPAGAPELEFGLAVDLRFTPGFVVEIVTVDGIEALAVSDGRGAERHREIELA